MKGRSTGRKRECEEEDVGRSKNKKTLTTPHTKEKRAKRQIDRHTPNISREQVPTVKDGQWLKRNKSTLHYRHKTNEHTTITKKEQQRTKAGKNQGR